MPIKDMILETRGQVSPVPPEAVKAALGSGDIAEHIQTREKSKRLNPRGWELAKKWVSPRKRSKV